MNTFELIKGVCTAVGIDSFPDVYQGDTLKKWAVYTLNSSDSVNIADNVDFMIQDDVTLDIYLPINLNFFELMHDVRMKLVAAGFTPPSVTTLIFADQRLRQLIFTTARVYKV